MLSELKQQVYEANLALVTHRVVIFTWGNASAIDRESGMVVIKPSGLDYAAMTPDDMVVLDEQGTVIEGRWKPSTDWPTHLELYKAFPGLAGVVHTHSTNATAWAQAGRDIPFYGTTHADYFYGDIPCSRALTSDEVSRDYEKNTGLVIAERFRGTNPLDMPGVLVKSHGVFAWGRGVAEAVHNAVVMEQVAEMALKTEQLCPACAEAPTYILEKHYWRKHGSHAYYGQTTGHR